jgi:hypothetical protein
MRTHCTLKELEELTGYLQFASQVIPNSQAFISALYNFTTTFSSPFTHCHIPRSAHCDISLWCTFTQERNRIHFIAPSCDIVHVYPNTSGRKGLGGVLDAHWFSACPPWRYSHSHIRVKEMYSDLLCALLGWVLPH